MTSLVDPLEGQHSAQAYSYSTDLTRLLGRRMCSTRYVAFVYHGRNRQPKRKRPSVGGPGRSSIGVAAEERKSTD